MKLLICYGSLTGNTEELCNNLAKALENNPKIQVTLLDQFDVIVSDLANYDCILIGASTWGDGELNPASDEFNQKIIESDEDLSGLKFIIIGLGDSIYEFFCAAADILSETIKSKGGDIIGERKIDGIITIELQEESLNWIINLIEKKC